MYHHHRRYNIFYVIPLILYKSICTYILFTLNSISCQLYDQISTPQIIQQYTYLSMFLTHSLSMYTKQQNNNNKKKIQIKCLLKVNL